MALLKGTWGSWWTTNRTGVSSALLQQRANRILGCICRDITSRDRCMTVPLCLALVRQHLACVQFWSPQLKNPSPCTSHSQKSNKMRPEVGDPSSLSWTLLQNSCCFFLYRYLGFADTRSGPGCALLSKDCSEQA